MITYFIYGALNVKYEWFGNNLFSFTHVHPMYITN